MQNRRGRAELQRKAGRIAVDRHGQLRLHAVRMYEIYGLSLQQRRGHANARRSLKRNQLAGIFIADSQPALAAAHDPFAL